MINGIRFSSKTPNPSLRIQTPNWQTMEIGMPFVHRKKLIGRKISGGGLEVRIFEKLGIEFLIDVIMTASGKRTQLSFSEFKMAFGKFKEYKRLIELLEREGKTVNTWKALSAAQERLKRSTLPRL